MSSFDSDEEFCALVKKRSTNIVLNRMDPMTASGISSDAEEAAMSDLTFTTDRFTNEPRMRKANVHLKGIKYEKGNSPAVIFC